MDFLAHTCFLTLTWHLQETLWCSVRLELVKKRACMALLQSSPAPPAICLSLTYAGHQPRHRKLFPELSIPRAALPRGGKLAPLMEVSLWLPLPSNRPTGDGLTEADQEQDLIWSLLASSLHIAPCFSLCNTLNAQITYSRSTQNPLFPEAHNLLFYTHTCI